jgi:phosphate transport system substrate-binding protein
MLHIVATKPGAIGYTAIHTLNTSVHTLAINGHTFSAGAIASGKYAFWGYEHMYSMSNNRNTVLSAFLQFMLTPTVQNQAKRMGYIPLTQVPLPTITLNSQSRSREAKE